MVLALIEPKSEVAGHAFTVFWSWNTVYVVDSMAREMFVRPLDFLSLIYGSVATAMKCIVHLTIWKHPTDITKEIK